VDVLTTSSTALSGAGSRMTTIAEDDGHVTPALLDKRTRLKRAVWHKCVQRNRFTDPNSQRRVLLMGRLSHV
jgi:hypothetical protein